jgi:molybdopterin molybdotransferase
MLSVEQALQQLLTAVQPVSDIEQLPLLNACHRVLARPHTARSDVPPADLSSMDGYAVNTNTLQVGEWTAISQRIPAGQAPASLTANTAARIFTGSVIPPGANAVVIQENCEAGGKRVRILTAPRAGDNIRRRGQDLRQSAEILPAGHRLLPPDVGLLAAGGIDPVSVFRRLRVAVLSSGDELVEPGEPLAPGKIYNANRFLLNALLTDIGVEVRLYPTIPDKLAATERALQQAAVECDVVVTSGGVSVGEEDHVKRAVMNVGTLDVWKLAIKPGKPLAYGSIGSTPFFGLPGNPVAVFVTFILVVRPCLLAMQGVRDVHTETLRYPAAFSIEHPNSRQEYIRVRIDKGRLLKYPTQDSSVLSSISWGNALAIVPPDATVAVGDELDVIPYPLPTSPLAGGGATPTPPNP